MMSQDAAETLAIKALAWLIADQDLMGTFMGASGASADDLRAGASDPHFLGSVLDFLMMDDQWVIRFGDDTGVQYDALMGARMSLPGGEQVHWT